MIHDPELRYKLLNGNQFDPRYAHPEDSGIDLAVPEDAEVHPYSVEKIPLDIAFDTPHGYEIQIRSRSSTPLRYPQLLLHIGTIDYGYTGNVCLIARNISGETVRIDKGTRLVQAVLAPVAHAYLKQISELPDKDRGAGGFGSTGE